MGDFDVIIIGAGAAGLMCALTAGARGRRVLLLDHAKAAGEKIRISGGGRCNFTNIHASPRDFLSRNPRFCVSALSRYTPRDFIALVERHGIAYHEKTLGQLFCDGSSRQIIDMLLQECDDAGVTLRLSTTVSRVEKGEEGYRLSTSAGDFSAASLVVATGGLSIPKMGATGFGYDLARQFGVSVLPTRAGLVPFTLDELMLERFRSLSGIAADSIAAYGKISFRESLLFTHRGLSGPSILQISSYWHEGEAVVLDLLPGQDAFLLLKEAKVAHPKQEALTLVGQWLPKRLAERMCDEAGVQGRLADLSHAKLQQLADHLNRWRVIPAGTEGYRTAEVTLGGVDTTALSSQTMESRDVPGLYFIGEVVDVTGHLGGFNFQWAWASGHAAGQVA